jgi:hypothetical protein
MIPMPDRLTLKLIAGIGAALLLAMLIHDRNHWKAKTGHYAELLAGERAAHDATVANARAAAQQARLADAANAERVRSEQSAIDERTRNDFESRVAAARAAAGRLRRKPEAAGADPGGRRATPVPGLSAGAEGIAQGTGQDRLPVSDRLIATEQAIQLDELIKWVRRQAAVEPSKD